MINLRTIIAAGAVSFALIAGAGYAFSEDAPVAPASECHIAPITSIDQLVEAGAKVSPVSQGEVDHLTETKGSPPGAEGKPFTVKRIDLNGMSALFVIQGDCINDQVGPVPSLMIDNVLGSVKAGA